jgi:predicted transcriptional regulator
MVKPVNDCLQDDLRCVDLLECFHGLDNREKKIFQLLYEVDDDLTIDGITTRLDCERSTAYRSICRLMESNLVSQEQVNYDQGGYYYVYYPRKPHDIADDLQRMLNDWYTQVARLIQDFEDTYATSQQDNVCPIFRNL